MENSETIQVSERAREAIAIALKSANHLGMHDTQRTLEYIRDLLAGQSGDTKAWLYEWKPATNNNAWQLGVSLIDPRIDGQREYRNVTPLSAAPAPKAEPVPQERPLCTYPHCGAGHPLACKCRSFNAMDLQSAPAPKAVDREEPRLVERRLDDECGCPEEIWEAFGLHLHMHLSAGKPSNGHADAGDEGEWEISVTADTVDHARAVIFGWAQSIFSPPSPDRDERGKLTMTIRLTEDEKAVLEKLMSEQELSPDALWRQALRLYQISHHEAKHGPIGHGPLNLLSVERTSIEREALRRISTLRALGATDAQH